MTILTDEQTQFLLSPIHPSRVSRDGKGFAHVEAFDVRRTLIRIFGYGGYSTDLQNVTLVSERENNGRHTVIYRATVLLTVRAADGTELGHWHGVAIGDAINQPSLADAHDLALKTADSQAFKRAAMNLGDQFGLSLYNKGAQFEPVVNRSLAHPAPGQPAAEPQPAVQEQPQPVTPPTPELDRKFANLAAGAYWAAARTEDVEEIRGLYRKASETGLLGIPVKVPGAGEMPLANYLNARAHLVAEKQQKAGAAA